MEDITAIAVITAVILLFLFAFIIMETLEATSNDRELRRSQENRVTRSWRSLVRHPPAISRN